MVLNCDVNLEVMYLTTWLQIISANECRNKHNVYKLTSHGCLLFEGCRDPGTKKSEADRNCRSDARIVVSPKDLPASDHLHRKRIINTL